MHAVENRIFSVYAEGLSVAISSEGRQHFLLREISLGISPGSFTSIIGPSGCGKSTLLKTLAGLLPVFGGQLHLGGHDPAEVRRHSPLTIGYLAQSGAFHGTLRVSEIISFAAALRLPTAMTEENRRNWLDHIIELTGIGGLLEQKFETLSGGQKRRVAIAETLTGDPAFLLLDELTSGLDPHSDEEVMQWLADLAHLSKKTVILVTHSVAHLNMCDTVVFLDHGRLLYCGEYDSLLPTLGAGSLTEAYRDAGKISASMKTVAATVQNEVSEVHLERRAHAADALNQFWSLLKRQFTLFRRDTGVAWLHFILLVTFPVLVALFATGGLPAVRSLSLDVEPNIVKTLTEQLLYLKESFRAASLVSGLAMFQVILLTLMGANNAAREIAREHEIIAKELSAGLSPAAYIAVKVFSVALLSFFQALVMTCFVKAICGFPGSAPCQFLILAGATFSMSITCLAISAAVSSPEKASLLSLYHVGLQLPLSGAVLALPDVLTWMTRPFVSAYWGWSGYLRTFQDSRIFDIIRETVRTDIAGFAAALLVLSVHVTAGAALAFYFVERRRAKGL